MPLIRMQKESFWLLLQLRCLWVRPAAAFQLGALRLSCVMQWPPEQQLLSLHRRFLIMDLR